MAIIGQNTLLNQYSPTVYVNNLLDGQILQYSSSRKAFVNSNAGNGSVTSVNIAGNDGISVTGSPVTASGTIALYLGGITPDSVTSSGPIIGSNLSGTNTGDQTITLTGDVIGTGNSGIITTLSSTGVIPDTYGSGTQVPVLTIDSKGRILSVTEAPVVSASSQESVVWHYGAGASGTFSPSDVLFSHSPGVSATVIDATNCVATYTFTGKLSPPKSIIFYGQNFSTNTFSITNLPGPNAANANLRISGGGSSNSPDIVNGIFGSSNVITLQTTMANVGASSTVGNRAWLLVIFGF